MAGHPWAASDRQTVERYVAGDLILQDRGVWYEAPGSDGVRTLNLHPTPGEAHPLLLEWVFAPQPAVDPKAIPTEFPAPFHEALLDQAAQIYYEEVEDNPELGKRHAEKVDRWVGELSTYDNVRRGGGDAITIPIVGVSA